MYIKYASIQIIGFVTGVKVNINHFSRFMQIYYSYMLAVKKLAKNRATMVANILLNIYS